MKHSDTIQNLAKALVQAQGELKAVHKDRENSHFRNKYATLDAIVEAVRPVLARHGLAVVQGATSETAGAITVETMLVHSSGEWLSNSAVLPLAKHDPQGAGSALTYGRRYSLSALLSLATDEDDDGEQASPRVVASQTPHGDRPAQSPGKAAGAASVAPTTRALPSAVQYDEPSCPVCSGPMWDDRGKKTNPRAPDFKCKNKPKTKGGPGCPGVIWPPNEAKEATMVPVPNIEEWDRAPVDDSDLPY